MEALLAEPILLPLVAVAERALCTSCVHATLRMLIRLAIAVYQLGTGHAASGSPIDALARPMNQLQTRWLMDYMLTHIVDVVAGL